MQEKVRYRKSYVHTYLKEAILSEQIVRNIDPFYAFLEVSSQMNGQILNYSKIGREAGLNDKAVEQIHRKGLQAFVSENQRRGRT